MQLLKLMGCLAWLVQAALAQATQELSLASQEPGVQLAAWWSPAPALAAGEAAPAVVALHGCDGLPENKKAVSWPANRYVKLLNEMGVGVLYLDSFTARGVSSICSVKGRKRPVTQEQRRLDVYGALTWLAAQPGVDASRLGVLGWSHGGQTVLAAADQTVDLVLNSPVKPRVLVAFYPGCNAFEKMFRYEVVAPLLIMTGELDDWTPPAACARLAQRLQAGQPAVSVRYIEYAGSYHGFDLARPPKLRDNVAGTASGQATVGGNPAARDASALALKAFLAEQFHLEGRP